jgi:hypothetical protein
VFRRIACDHKGDADFIDARNVLTKTRAVFGRVLSPGQKMTAHQLDVFGQTVRRRAVYAVPRGSKSPDGEGDSHEQCTDRIAATR